MQLPNAALAIVAEAKIVRYLLSPVHPRGGSKARYFLGYGFRTVSWNEFADAIRALAASNPVSSRVESAGKMRYVVEGLLHTPSGRQARVRTVWVIEGKATVPRFITAYPLEARKWRT